MDIVAQFEAQAQPNYLLPQGSPKNAPPDVVALWKSAGIAYRKSQSEKTPVDVPPEEFLAWLPAGIEELVALWTPNASSSWAARVRECPLPGNPDW